MGGIGQKEDRLDASEVAVDDRHGRLVGDIHLRAHALDEHARADIRAVVDEKPDTPRRDPDVALEPGIRDRLLDEGDALGDGQERGLVGVVHHEHVELVEEARCTIDDVQVPEGDRVE